MRSTFDDNTHIVVDGRWLRQDGIGRFARGVLSSINLDISTVDPGVSIFNPFEQVALPVISEFTSADLFFSPGINPPVLSATPFVFVIHDLIPLVNNSESSTLKKYYYNRYLKYAVRRSSRVLTVSDFSRRQILQWSGVDGDHVVVVGNGVSGKFSPKGQVHDPGYPYLLYVGNTRPHKNVASAIEGYALSGISDEVKFVLSGNPTPELSAVIQEYDVDCCVEFAHFIPEDELPAYYRGATALVHPSLHEGFGLPVLEALACGTAVVASNATAIPEVTGDAAYLFDPTSTAEIASAIRKIVLDDSLRASLERRGPERARRFSWEKVARRTESALRAALP